MQHFANGAETPHFDSAAIVRGARRKRATTIAGIAAALVVVGGGTALATIGSGGGSSTPQTAPAATATATAADTTVLLGHGNGKTSTIPLGGVDSGTAKALLAKNGLHVEFAKGACDGKPTSVIAVSPHSPTVVNQGDTIRVTLCAG
ncbi:PASTA domain-containing protein [Streptomyces sp. NPDC026672]|uniref:PASTA domain-containing protein n=1 Tax=unclassified Streptomyces TaxID=2593676 RepID=UPI0033F391EF